MSALSNLSDIDFEELCRDIALKETGMRFSGFGPGPDGGIDGRHAKDGNGTVLQCKHYINSSFSNLRRAVAKEVPKIDRLSPDRYIFFTSQSLTPKRSDTLAGLLGAHLIEPGDIWSQQDIEDALRRNPDIEKAHLKLWLSSTAVLERLLKSGLEAYTQTTKREILDDLRVYVRNNSFDEAASKLETEKVLVISGPPGVGKTTLAKMLSYYYLNEGWRFVAIRKLDEGFEIIDDETPTIFFFDDFLGRIELDRQSLLQRESALATFVRRVQKSKNARFVLTTRAHIFEEARRLSDYVDDKRFQLAKYLLDVGSYTRRIKAYILFNHLAASNLSSDHCFALLQGDWLKKIIDHKNYNPRVISSVSSDALEAVEAKDYPRHVFDALEDPDLIWSKPFRGLEMKAQNLLITLFFCGQFGTTIQNLQSQFSELHRHVSAHYGQPASPSDFEDTLRSLETGFLSIAGQTVSFVNPSVRDFLKSYLVDQAFLALLPVSIQRADTAAALWSHMREVFKQHPETLRGFVDAFLTLALRIDVTPSMKRVKTQTYWSHVHDDSSLSDRVDLLFQWWEASGNDAFLEKAHAMLVENKLALIAWRDGRSLPNLHWFVRNYIDNEHPLKDGLLSSLSDRLIEVIESGAPVDELITIVESVQEHMGDEVPEAVEEALNHVVGYEFNNTSQAISHLDSKQYLSEHIEQLEALSRLTGYDAEPAKQIVNERLAEFEVLDYDEYRPSVSRPSTRVDDRFDDDAIKSLFSNLVR